jgi:tRNA(Ile)-lysidine synthase
MLTTTLPSLPLIPVLVTGIQPPRVCAVNNFNFQDDSSAPKDLGALDSCDEHRNEGEFAAAAKSMPQRWLP